MPQCAGRPTSSIRATVRSHSSLEHDCMCAQKEPKPSELGHLAIASRRRSSVRWRSAPSMRAIAALKARLKNMQLILRAAMSAGAGGRSAGTGAAGFYSRPSFPNTLRFFRAFSGHVAFLPNGTSGQYSKYSKPHHVNRDYHRTDPHHDYRDYHLTDPHRYPNTRKTCPKCARLPWPTRSLPNS